jgi:hypothetical protein
MKVHFISYAIASWIAFATVGLVIILHSHHWNSSFFRFGPNDGLKIFDITINTPGKYIIVILYTTISTIVRTGHQEVITPWIIQNVQNHNFKDTFTREHAYIIVTVETVYRWFDWFMYMNILLAQVDMMMVEIIGNLLTSLFTTRKYIQDSVPKTDEDTALLEMTSIKS